MRLLHKLFAVVFLLFMALLTFLAYIGGGLKGLLFMAWIILAFAIFLTVTLLTVDKSLFSNSPKNAQYWFLRYAIDILVYRWFLGFLFAVLFIATIGIWSYLDKNFPTEEKRLVPVSVLPSAVKASAHTQTDIPCLDKVSYDCIANFIFDNQRPEDNAYDNFNNNLRPYLSLFCDVKDRNFLEAVNRELEKYEKNGVLEEFDKNIKVGSGFRGLDKSYFGRPSIRIKHACILDALGRKEEAQALTEKYSIPPVSKLELADHAINQGELDKAYELLASITNKDISYGMKTSEGHYWACFDCRSQENLVLEKLIKAIAREQKYDLLEKTFVLFSELPTGDDWYMTEESARKIFNSYTTEGQKAYMARYCDRANEHENKRKKLVCTLLGIKYPNDTNSDLWISYIDDCRGPERHCAYNALTEYQYVKRRINLE